MKNILWLFFRMIVIQIGLSETSAFAQDKEASLEKEVNEQKKRWKSKIAGLKNWKTA